MTSAISSRNSDSWKASSGGFTLIELLLMTALIIVIVTLALPVYSNYTVRSRVSESMEIANDTKAIIAEACNNKDGGSLENALHENAFIRKAVRQPYIRDIQFNGTCTAPVITVTMKNTGQLPNPVLMLTVNPDATRQQLSWRCTSKNTPDHRLPKNCQG